MLLEKMWVKNLLIISDYVHINCQIKQQLRQRGKATHKRMSAGFCENGNCLHIKPPTCQYSLGLPGL